MVETAKVARQIFEFHKIWHKLFNSQPILKIKGLKFTYNVRLKYILTHHARFLPVYTSF
jgi:hypothetical protein